MNLYGHIRKTLLELFNIRKQKEAHRQLARTDRNLAALTVHVFF